MYSNKIRIILLAVVFCFSVYFLVSGMYTAATMVLLSMLMLMAGYFMNGTVLASLRKLGRNDFEGAERMLKQTRFPNYLAGVQKAYYNLVAGMIEARKGNYGGAAGFLEKALAGKLRNTHDKTIVKLNLASIYFNMGKRDQAAAYLEELKQAGIDPRLQPKIDELEAALAGKR